MRVLIDPRIFVIQKNDEALTDSIKKLFLVFKEMDVNVAIHPLSIRYFEESADVKTKQIILSEIQKYTILDEHPDFKSDQAYLDVVKNTTVNDDICNTILYPIYKESVEFLITEDRSIHKKASALSIEDRVFLVDEALQVFSGYVPEFGTTVPLPLKNELVKNLNLEDPIFESLKKEYPEFQDWLIKISIEGRSGWVYYRNDGSIGALLIYKIEDEPVDVAPQISDMKRLKISTLKVTHVGYKIGELFIKLAVDISLKNNVSEIYLTHFTQAEDRLVELISEYGFDKVGINSRNEEVFVKKLTINREEAKLLTPIDISKKFYPSFYDGAHVNKFVVPIRPIYHNRLFTDFGGRQSTLSEYAGEFVIEGNTIKKAYLSHSNIRKMMTGDLVLFYRSEDLQAITSIGVVEAVHTGIEDGEQIVKLVGKRTVFSRKEIDDLIKKPVSVFLFRHHLHLSRKLRLNTLIEAGILKGAPRSVMEISDHQYKKSMLMGGIDEHFTID